MLTRFGIQYRFHATEYWSRKGEFMRMKESDHATLGQEIRRLDGTFYALDWCLTTLIHRINQYPRDDGVEIIFDQRAGSGNLDRAISGVFA
ncbi:hypothetical protein [Bradyrhizobium liaoningense]